MTLAFARFLASASTTAFVASTVVLAPTAAFAQDATSSGLQAGASTDGADVGTIVVTARKSIDTPAEQIKRNATGIVDSITAEDIARTTDTTLPEALERVVGVSADAFYGTSDPGYVSIRGFDSRYNSMEIDGNPIWFSSQNNRGAQINMFPTTIVKETSVSKTVTPDQDANSIGGHISLRTLRSFDGDGAPYLTAGGRVGGYEQDSRVNSGASGNVYFAAKNAFGADKQFGAVFGFNYQRYSNADNYGGVDSYTQVNERDQPSGNVYSDSAYDKLTRNMAIYAKVEAQVSDKLYAFVSGNAFVEDKDLYLQRANVFVSATGNRTIMQTGDGTGNFTGGEGQIRVYDYDIHRSAKVIGGGVDYAVADRTALTVRANYTDFFNDILTRNLGDGIRLSNVNGSYDLTGDVPRVVAADPARYNDPANWIFRNTASTSGSASYNRDQILKDKVYAVRADLKHNTQAGARGIGFGAGVSWTRLDRSFDQDQRFYSLRPGTPTLTLAQVTDPGASMQNNEAIKNDWNGFWSYLIANGVSRVDSAPTTDYALKEDVLAGHAAVHYAGAQFRLIAGFRYEHTRDDIATANLVRNVPTPVTHRTNYDNWLPNVQATFDAAPRLRLRAAFTKTIGRPDFADFAPGLTTTFDANGIPVNNGTNPNLGPRVSTNYDASIEYYLTDGLLALSLFHKRLEGETFDERFEERDAAGNLSAINTIPLNTGSAKVTGIEVTAAKRRLDFLPGLLSRFGLQANFTWLDGKWNVVFTDGATRAVGGLRNQPKWLANIQARYDAGPVDLSVNYRMRGRTFTGTFGTTPVGDRWIDGYDALDAKISIAVRRGINLSLEARNLTDSYIRQTTGAYDSLYNAVGAGRSYFAGLRFRY